MGGNADAIVKKVCEKALNDDDKDQGMMLKILMDRLVPVQKAVEISAMGGKAISVTVHVDAVESYSGGRIIDAND